jgi:hypothetical protein
MNQAFLLLMLNFVISSQMENDIGLVLAQMKCLSYKLQFAVVFPSMMMFLLMGSQSEFASCKTNSRSAQNHEFME